MSNILAFRPADKTRCAGCEGFLRNDAEGDRNGGPLTGQDSILLVMADKALWFCSMDCVQQVARAYDVVERTEDTNHEIPPQALARLKELVKADAHQTLRRAGEWITD